MTKTFVTAIIGLLLFLEGSILGLLWFFREGLSAGLHPQPVIAFALIVSGVFLTAKALRKSNITKQVTEIQMQKDTVTAEDYTLKKDSVIDRNNELIKQWSHTYRMREKLKMVKAASASEQGKNG